MKDKYLPPTIISKPLIIKGYFHLVFYWRPSLKKTFCSLLRCNIHPPIRQLALLTNDCDMSHPGDKTDALPCSTFFRDGHIGRKVYTFLAVIFISSLALLTTSCNLEEITNLGGNKKDDASSNASATNSNSSSNTQSSPSVPHLLGTPQVTQTDVSKVTLMWQTATDDSTSQEEMFYEIHLAQQPNFYPVSATKYATVVGETQTEITGLIVGTNYWVVIIAIDRQGNRSPERAYQLVSLTPCFATFSTPVVAKLAENTYTMTVMGSDGSQYVVTIKKTDKQVFPESVKYIPAGLCKMVIPPYTMQVNPEATAAELQYDNSPILWTLEKQEETVKLKVKEDGQEIDVITFPPSPSSLDGEESPQGGPDLTNPLCALGNDFCKKLKKLDISGKLAKVAAVTAAAGIIPVPGVQVLEVPAGIFGAFALAFKALDLTCLVLFGDDKQFAKAVAGIIMDVSAGAIKNFRPLTAKLTKISQEFTKQLPMTDMGKTAGNRLAKFAAEEFFGKAKDFVEKKVENLISSLYNQNGIPENGLMAKLRKQLGLDFCDNPPASENPSITLTAIGPTKVEFGGTTVLEVSYTAPQGNARVIWITGFGGLSNGVKSIGGLSPGQQYRGTFKINVRNNPSYNGCSTFDQYFAAELYDRAFALAPWPIASTEPGNGKPGNGVTLTLLGDPDGKGVFAGLPCQAAADDVGGW